MKSLDNLLDSVTELAMGNTKRVACPACRRANALTITRFHDGLVWNCYYASCGISGKRVEGMSKEAVSSFMASHANEQSAAKKSFAMPESFVDVSRREDAAKIISKYGIDPVLRDGRIELKYDARDNRLAFLVRHEGVLQDAIGRAMTPGATPKWLRYNRSDYALIVPGGSTVVIVEDAFSAAVIALHGYTGCALMGTSLRATFLQQLSSYKLAYICLDKDATNKAVYAHKELDAYVTTKVRMLDKDIKDMTLTERKALTITMEMCCETACNNQH